MEGIFVKYIFVFYSRKYLKRVASFSMSSFYTRERAEIEKMVKNVIKRCYECVTKEIFFSA